MPYFPKNSKSTAYFSNQTSDFKIVSDYSGFNFNEVHNLGIFEYFGLLHDAVVWNCSQCKEGLEYLENAWNYSQTSPDRNQLRKIFGR